MSVTLVYTPDVEPTNNAAERALRPAVIWRRTSFGSQSEAGSQFVSWMLTVSTSLKAQNRPVLEVLTHACRAARLGQEPPSLLPEAEMIPAQTPVLLIPQAF
jgi:transposase